MVNVINCGCLDKNGGFVKEKENVINNDDNIIENKIFNNGSLISSKSGSCSSGGNLCSSGNDEGQRYPNHNIKTPVYLNDYDVSDDKDIMNFFDYYYLLSIPENHEDGIQNDVHKNENQQ